MRIRKRNLKTYTAKQYGSVKEPDGTTSTGWSDPFEFEANIQPASGKAMADIYGVRLAYMLIGFTEASMIPNELDGVCVYVDPDKDPDYKVVAVHRWGSHKVLHLEKVRS